MEMFNRDIFPDNSLINANPDLAALISNVQIADAFKGYENRAVRWKSLYNKIGTVSLICAAATAVYLAFRVMLEPLYGMTSAIPLGAIVVAVLGLGAQLILLFSRMKERWLVNRLAAERLRCLKFRLFGMVLARAQSAAEIESLTKIETDRHIAAIALTTRGGLSAVLSFRPIRELGDKPPVAHRMDADFVGTAYEVYRNLRIAIQQEHFTGRVSVGEQGSHVPRVLSEISLLLGIILSVLEVIWLRLPEVWVDAGLVLSASLQKWIYFLIWIAFVASAILAVYKHARGITVDTNRYREYLEHITLVEPRRTPHTMRELIETIWRMEEIYLEELHDFCQNQEHTNFLF